MAITPGMLFGQSYHNSCPQHQDSRDRSGSKVSTARRRYIAARSAPGSKVRSPVSAGQVGPHRNVRGWQILVKTLLYLNFRAFEQLILAKFP
ncbi:MAG: hypothetical protein GDA38_13330 [Hormoscilla sp. SP12CHS1]|nr:hypothetical protein [Hormoscilla sp. SP12CHS1]